MAAILGTVSLGLKLEEDGPHITADGKVFFTTITISGVYDQADRPKLVHDQPNDLSKVAGIKYVTNIEPLSMSGSAAAGNSTDTGRYFLKFDVPSQRAIVIRSGLGAGGTPIDQGEVGTGADFSGANALIFVAKVTGT